jgi:hypothetical protein
VPWLWLVAVLVCAASLWRLAGVSADQVAAPFDLAYETPNLRSIQLMQRGESVYSPELYEQAPWWLTPYTPLYHHLVALFPAHEANPFVPGRLVAMGCMLLAACSLFAAGGRAVPLSLLAFGLFFLVRPVTSNTAFLKNDTLALLFSVWAVALLARARGRLPLQVLSAVLCALAFCAKQSYGAASAACVLWLLFTDPRRGLVYLGVGVASLALAIAWAWSDGFLFCVFVALLDPMLASQLGFQLQAGLRQPVTVAMALLGLAALTRIVAARRWPALLATPYRLYALTTVTVMLIILPKVGSSMNYYIEPTLALLLCFLDWGRGVAAARGPDAAPARRAGALVVAAFALAAGAELALAGPYDVAFTTRENNAERGARFEEIRDVIVAATRPEPRLLNLFYAGLSYPVSATLELDDPLLYYLLWEAGWLSPQPVIDAIERREFDAILLQAGFLERPPSNYTPAVLDAVRRHYATAYQFGVVQVLLRRS